MEIRQFRVVIRTRFYERALKFYGGSLALPRISDWEHEDSRGAVFQAGAGVLEVVGRLDDDPRRRDEAFDTQGPVEKMRLVFLVPSAQQAYDEAFFRDKNVPGGLRKDLDGVLIFETHDPDGIRILFKESQG
ncbi:MAG TPA: VOC family protein [Thermoanaerobaculia bacterium]|nr:VOC family protein [Thermoanaerobaculia bacterium]